MNVRNVVRVVAAASAILCASHTWAVIIQGGTFDGTNVGGADELQGQADNSTISALCGPGGSPAVEECWSESILGTDLIFDDSKTENVTAYATDTANVIAFPLAFQGEYFLLKNATWSALYHNVADLGWGVVDISLLDPGFNLNAGGLVISHVTEFNPTSVPEPGAVTLLGLGLLGLGLGRMRRKTA